MISYLLGADTRIDYDWTDEDDNAIVPTDATFEITDGTDEPLLSLQMGDAGLVTSDDHALELHLEDDLDIPTGLYHYVLNICDGTDWSVLSAGLFRARSA